MRKIINTFVVILLILLIPLNYASATLIAPPCPPSICPPQPPPEPVEPNPVIILPGIGASFNPDLFLSEIFNDNWSFFPGVSAPYDDLEHALADAGYIKGQNLFIAFYDWRQDNAQSATQYLIPIIDEALQKSGKDKVDIVAHSMGGLVARSYIQSNEYLSRNDVDQLMLLGVPNFGSSDAYLLWGGAQLPQDWSVGLKFIVTLYLNYYQTFSIPPLQNRTTVFRDKFPSTAQMIPTYDHLVESETGNVVVLSNEFLTSLNAGITSLPTRVGGLSVVAGDQVPTINQVTVEKPSLLDNFKNQWADGKPNPNPPAKDSTEGDNRVLLTSSLIPDVDTTIIPDGVHDRLPSLAQNEVITTLTGSSPAVVYNTPDPESILGFMAASPVEIEIIDPNGNIISKTNLSNGAEFLAETNPEGVKLIFIPDPLEGDYLVQLTGIGAGGQYHLITGFADNSTTTDEVIAGDIEPGETVQYMASFNESSQTPLQTQIVDTTPPTIEIFSPEQNKSYLNSGNLEIDFNVSDDESGVASSLAELDGQTVIDTQIIDLSLIGLGNHELKVEAEDNTGNIAESMVQFETHTTLESLKDNLEHYWQEGLITKFGTYMKLKAKLIGLENIFKTKTELEAKTANTPWYLKHAFNKGLNGLNKAISKQFNQFIKEVKKAKGKTIDEPAADLLIEQVEYLQDNL